MSAAVIRPFKTKPDVFITSPVSVYKLVSHLGLEEQSSQFKGPEWARRKRILGLVAHSLAGVRTGSESAEAWAAKAQKHINNVSKHI